MTEEQAIAYVKLHAQTAAFPTVEDSTVEEIVRRNVRAVVWTPETIYKVGDRVQPTSANGHFYECVAAGESNSVEPDWFTKTGSLYHEFASDLIWRECAIDIDGNLFNLRNAIHEIWTLKTAMAANQFDVSVDQQKWNRSQVYDHCRQMAQSYAPID